MESPNGPYWDEIKVWRKSLRAELIARRAATPDTRRKEWNERITQHLVAAFEMPPDTVVGYCWPYKGEFDARYAIRHWRERGAAAALPEVVASKTPLQFRRWWPGSPMKPGVYDIPVPDGTEILVPDVAIVPMNAFDACGFRLGYGGGFFDRTLEALASRVVAIGVSYETLRVPTIRPQPHDLPMDFVVTEAGIHAASGAPLTLLPPEEARTRFEALLARRGLPRAAYAASGYSSPACYAAEFPEYFGGKSNAD
jgi:5,10-methenyltetrahydrofolate synthetase